MMGVCTLAVLNRKADGKPWIGVPMEPEGTFMTQADRHVSLMTKGGTYVDNGLVLEVDLGASLPIRVEYIGPNGEKRIERFSPDEIAWITGT